MTFNKEWFRTYLKSFQVIPKDEKDVDVATTMNQLVPQVVDNMSDDELEAIWEKSFGELIYELVKGTPTDRVEWFTSEHVQSS